MCYHSSLGIMPGGVVYVLKSTSQVVTKYSNSNFPVTPYSFDNWICLYIHVVKSFQLNYIKSDFIGLKSLFVFRKYCVITRLKYME